MVHRNNKSHDYDSKIKELESSNFTLRKIIQEKKLCNLNSIHHANKTISSYQTTLLSFTNFYCRTNIMLWRKFAISLLSLYGIGTDDLFKLACILCTLPSRNYQHGRQDRARLKTEAEPKLKLIYPYQQQISIS